MSNYPSFRLVALLLLCAAAPRESFVAAASPPNSSASVTSQPLLDPDILSMLDQVDANRISADIQTLVSFGTRNTCSDNSGASPGIGAARDWIQNRYLSLPGLQVTLVPWTYGELRRRNHAHPAQRYRVDSGQWASKPSHRHRRPLRFQNYEWHGRGQPSAWGK